MVLATALSTTPGQNLRKRFQAKNITYNDYQELVDKTLPIIYFPKGKGKNLSQGYLQLLGIFLIICSMNFMSLYVGPKSNEIKKQILTIERYYPKEVSIASDNGNIPVRRTINMINSIDEKDRCQPIHENGQDETSYHPSCNLIHEISLSDITYLSAGNYRATFKSKDSISTDIVFKLLIFGKSYFSPEQFEKQQRDAMALESLSASDHVLQIFGFCGASQILEYASGGNLYDLIMFSRTNKGAHEMVSSLDKLRVAVQISTGVADLHDIAHVSHRDLCCHQFVYVDGVYKINDFHLARYTHQDQITKKICLLYDSWDDYKYRSPEEYESILSKSYLVDGEAADVFMLGNVLYSLLTERWIFENLNHQTTLNLLLNGHRSDYPSEIKNSSDPIVAHILSAINLCWTHDASKRPSARFISKFLERKLKLYLGRNNDELHRIKLPLFEPGYSDDEFYALLQRQDNVLLE